VFGDRDRLLPKPHDQVRELAPEHAAWVVMYRCGHAPMWDSPGETVAEIISAIQRIDPTASKVENGRPGA
jgi:pimeloyl-ACP methyl ester carboxylesterase